MHAVISGTHGLDASEYCYLIAPLSVRCFNDLRAITLEQFQELTLFGLADFVLSPHLDGVFAVGFPLCFCNAKSAMRRLHVAPEIYARSARKRAELFHGKLLYTH